jgi:hypothetical protein
MTGENDTTNDAREPVQAAGPAVPPVPQPQSVPQPQPQPSAGQPRRGLPGWAWALIIGGAVVVITVVVLVALAANAILGAVSRADDAASRPVPPPAATATALAPEATGSTEPPGAGDAAGALISLNEQADLGSSVPIWRYPILADWEITTFDQGGINTSQNSALGCVFTSSQNQQPAQDVTATDDLTDSLATFEVLEDRKLLEFPGAELIGDLGTAEFAVAYPGGRASLEFITSRIDYLDQDLNVPYTSEIAARAMPLAESFLYIEVACPTALVDAGQSPFDELREGLEVLVER